MFRLFSLLIRRYGGTRGYFRRRISTPVFADLSWLTCNEQNNIHMLPFSTFHRLRRMNCITKLCTKNTTRTNLLICIYTHHYYMNTIPSTIYLSSYLKHHNCEVKIFDNNDIHIIQSSRFLQESIYLECLINMLFANSPKLYFGCFFN